MISRLYTSYIVDNRRHGIILNNTGHENGIDIRRKLGSGWLVVGKDSRTFKGNSHRKCHLG